MSHELFIALIAGLCGMLGWGLADFFAKLTIDKVGDIVSLVWAHICGAIILGIVALVAVFSGSSATVPHDAQTWILLAFFGTLQAAVYLFAYKGFAKGQVAVLNPIFASFTGLVALFSILFLGEVVSGSLIGVLVVVFLGVMLLATDMQALRERGLHFAHVPGFREIAAATLLATIWTILWKLFVTGEDWLWYALYMYAFMACATLLYAYATRVRLSGIPRATWIFLSLIGLSEVVAYVGISLGYASTSYTSIVALVSGAFSLPTIFLAHIILRERTTPLQRAGMLFVIVGVCLVALV